MGKLPKIPEKGGEIEKRVVETKILKMGQAGTRVGALERGGSGIPLKTMSITKGKDKRKCDHKSVIKPWLEKRNQQKKSSQSVP